MKIAIYDDSPYDVMVIKEYAQKLMMDVGIKYSITVYNDTDSLMKDIYRIDLLFLDIELKGENGIEIGLDIRNKKASCKIIITSSYQKYLIDGYKIKAERYFIKPINKKQFLLEMKSILDEYFYSEYGISDEKIAKEKIYIHNIMYIEYFDKHTVLHCVNGKKYTTPYTLKYWEEKLKNLGFSQCYKCFIVNCQFVDYIDKIDVILINTEKISISRHYRSEFENAYVESMRKKL